MNSEKLLGALEFLDDEYLTEADKYTKDNTVNRKSVTKPRRVFLIAAVVVTTLSLLGCAMIYLVEAVFPGAALPEMPIESISTEDIHMTVSDVSPTGLTVNFVIEDFDAESYHTVFVEGGSFTLEKKSESGWESMEKKAGMEGAAHAVMNDGKYSWPIVWYASYGLLEPGDYRITLEVIEGLAPFTAEFTVENEPTEMETIEAFLAEESFHLRYTSYYTFSGLDSIPDDKPRLLESYKYLMEEENYSCYEYWKYGENFLFINYNDVDMPYSGRMYLDGKKYQAINEPRWDSTTPIVSWEAAPDFDFNGTKDLWKYQLLQSDRQISYEYDTQGKIAKITITFSEATGTFDIIADNSIFIEVIPSSPESIEADFNSQREKILP